MARCDRRVRMALLCALCSVLFLPAHGQQTRPASGREEGSSSGPPPAYPPGFDVARSDPRALALVLSCLESMGGSEAWQAVGALRFAFVVERGNQRLGRRIHYWDRQSRRHRVEMKDRRGRSLVVSEGLGRADGEALSEGALLAGEDLVTALEEAYAAWVNDTYWLLMPYKTLDPGVTLAYEGPAHRNRGKYHRVRLTFDEVGLTPGDVYWAWINDRTRRMDYWSYHLQGTPEDKPESVFAWLDWEDFGGVLLSLTREQVDLPEGKPGLTIRFEHLALFEALPDTVFRAADAVPPTYAP